MLFIGYGNVLEGRELGSWLFISCINSSLSHKSTTLGKYLVIQSPLVPDMWIHYVIYMDRMK
jgi:hypothetical protein